MALKRDAHGHPLRQKPAEGFAARLLVATYLTCGIVALLVLRLYTLQVLRGEEMHNKGRRNFVSQLQVPHDRGIIYDRDGQILVDNRPSLDLRVTPAFLGRAGAAEGSWRQLAQIVGLSPNDRLRLQQVADGKIGLERFRPLPVARDLSPAQVEAIESQRSLFALDGVDIAEGRRRTYLYGPMAAHVLGYVGEIDQGALDAERARGNPQHYELGDLIGRDGLERSLEAQLRGQDGSEKVVVDAKGRRQPTAQLQALLGPRRRIEPRPGHNVYLTLDLTLQQRAESSLLEYGSAGSVVAIDPRSGELLVLASLPAYDVNVVSGAFSAKEKARLDADPLKPWLNRSIAGQYVPGSTFKIVTALAGLEQKATPPHERIHCPGNYKMGRHTWRCWRDAGHGPTDLRDAFKTSCDVFFYTLAGRMGIEPIAEMARRLGFGSRTGIGLRGEMPGTVPDEAFHRRVDARSGGYVRGMAINTSIGQGALQVTPLQLALAYAAVGQGEAVLRPQLVRAVHTADMRRVRRVRGPAKGGADGGPSGTGGEQGGGGARVVTSVEGEAPHIIEQAERQVRTALGIDPALVAEVRAGLNKVAQEPGGSAYNQRSHLVDMAGKTGTAQVVKLGRERRKAWQTDYFERDHAWFVGYAPAEDPEIVVAVLNEHAGHGGSAAEPIAVRVIDAYFTEARNRRARLDAAAAAAKGREAP